MGCPALLLAFFLVVATFSRTGDALACDVFNAEGAIDRSASVLAFGVNATRDIVLTSLGLQFLNPTIAHDFGNKSAVRSAGQSRVSCTFVLVATLCMMSLLASLVCRCPSCISETSLTAAAPK